MPKGRTQSEDVITINVEKLENDLRQIEGERFAGTKIAEFIMGYDKTYWSYMRKEKRCNVKGLNKLCSYYNLQPDDYKAVAESIKPAETPKAFNIDTVVIGLNQLYQIEKENNELMKQILEQIKVQNTKTNRLENALGQIVGNVVEIKDTTNGNNTLLRDLKSTGAVVSGRLRDIQQNQQKK